MVCVSQDEVWLFFELEFDSPGQLFLVFQIFMQNCLKPHLWFDLAFSHNTSFFIDPWCLEIPLAFKPTFHNMDFNFKQIQVDDLVSNGFWDNSMLEDIFGAGFNSHSMKLGMIDPNSANVWVWFPASNNNRLSTSVYQFLNINDMNSFVWNGWQKVWKLSVAPRVTFFTWLVLHERI